jgi:hypothetical protein
MDSESAQPDLNLPANPAGGDSVLQLAPLVANGLAVSPLGLHLS